MDQDRKSGLTFGRMSHAGNGANSLILVKTEWWSHAPVTMLTGPKTRLLQTTGMGEKLSEWSSSISWCSEWCEHVCTSSEGIVIHWAGPSGPAH